MPIEVNRNNTKKDIPDQSKTLIFIKISKRYKKDKKVTGDNKRTKLNTMGSSKKEHGCNGDGKTNRIDERYDVVVQNKGIVKKEESKRGRT